MNRLIPGFIALLAAAIPVTASAATVTNLDDTTHVLMVSEGGNQVELSIGPGETIEICPDGCFVTLPNGDREVLTGSETLQIEASRGKIF